MKGLIRIVIGATLFVAMISCKDVAFRSAAKGSDKSTGTDCGTNCPSGSYAWHEGGFGTCSKACGGGTQTQVVECRRVSDDAVVPDSNCTPPKPATSKTCNVQACTGTYNWNIGTWGACSKTCGGGTRTRTVVCQDQSGATVADSNCTPPKPSTSEICNTDTCPTVSYSWNVTPGTCSKQCGGGTATDIVVCKKNDGTTVADSFCDPATKPATTRTCNPDLFTLTLGNPAHGRFALRIADQAHKRARFIVNAMTARMFRKTIAMPRPSPHPHRHVRSKSAQPAAVSRKW
jgi:hypothetical protein